MKKSLGIVLLVVAGILLFVLIFGAGFVAGRATNGRAFLGPNMMQNWRNRFQGSPVIGSGCSSLPGSNDKPGNSTCSMGSYPNGNIANTTPITVDEAKQAVETYLKGLGNSDLELAEIMVFDNNAYARIVEKSTGIGAMELLVDPVSKVVFPEYGPNMMWNLKYGHMGRLGGMMGGMMGQSQNNSNLVDATMSVTPQEALQAAQNYLDQEFPGYKTAADADPFYGYYTIDILKDGKVYGMLSVNGFNAEVFFHSWHGTFIEESD